MELSNPLTVHTTQGHWIFLPNLSFNINELTLTISGQPAGVVKVCEGS
jgi:hypothetical protein